MRKNKQSGYTLLELMLVIGIMAVIAVLAAQSQKLEFEQMGAKALGMELFRYNSAVQRYVSHMSGTDNPSSVTGVKTGVDWLKQSGGAAVNYLPVSFLVNQKTTHGRLSFTTTITYDVNSGLVARTVMSPFLIGTSQRGDLSGLAALVASGAYVFNEEAGPPMAEDGTVVYCIDIATMSTAMQALCQTDRNQIVMFAKNLSSTDKWLRVDHGNVAQHTIEFKSPDPLNANSITPSTNAEIAAIDSRNNRHLRNVSRIYNLGIGGSNAESENLVIGKRLGDGVFSVATLASNGVIIDADQEILGSLRVTGVIESTGSVTSKDGNIYAKDAAGGNNSTNAGNIEADNNITARQDLIAQQNLQVFQNAFVDGDIYAIGSVQTKKDLVVGGNATINQDMLIDGNQVTNGWVVAEGEIIGLNNIRSSANIYAKKLIDIDDPALRYQVDPSGNSTLNQISTNVISADNGSNIDFVSSSGTTTLRGNMNIDQFNIDIGGGTYIPLKNMLPTYVHMETKTVSNGSVITKPTCSSGGIPKIILIAASSGVNSYTPEIPTGNGAEASGAWQAYATENGSSWTAYIGSVDAGGTTIGDGLANLYCEY